MKVKYSQVKSTSSTHQSCKQVEHHMSSCAGLGGKKFMRKRQGSNESFRRNNIEVVQKSRESNFAERSDFEKEDIKVNDLVMSTIIKGNSFIKCFQTPGSKKMSESMGPGMFENQKQLQKCNMDSSSEKKQTISKFQTPKTRLNRAHERSFQNCRILNSNSSKRITKLSMQNTVQPVYKFLNYNEAQTDRQMYKGSEKVDMSSEIKILENEIIILEDENNRLKRQFSQLANEKEQQTKLRMKTEALVKELETKVILMREKENELMKRIKKEMHQLYLEIVRDVKSCSLTDIKEINQQVFIYKPQALSPRSKNSSQRFRKQDILEQKFDIIAFTQIFLQPAMEVIKDSLQNYNKALQKSQAHIQKLQIKQSILLRSTQQLQSSKNKNKLLANHLQQEKTKIQRIIQQCQNLKKQNKQMKLSLIELKNNKSKTKSVKALGYKSNEETISLCFSESDQQITINLEGNKHKKINN